MPTSRSGESGPPVGWQQQPRHPRAATASCSRACPSGVRSLLRSSPVAARGLRLLRESVACPPASATVQEANSQLRVFKLPDGAVYACHVGSRRRVSLADADDRNLGGSWRVAQRYVLRGPRIAWASNFCDEIDDVSTIRVATLSTGARRSVAAFARDQGGSHQTVTDLSLARDGTVACPTIVSRGLGQGGGVVVWSDVGLVRARRVRADCAATVLRRDGAITVSAADGVLYAAQRGLPRVTLGYAVAPCQSSSGSSGIDAFTTRAYHVAARTNSLIGPCSSATLNVWICGPASRRCAPRSAEPTARARSRRSSCRRSGGLHGWPRRSPWRRLPASSSRQSRRSARPSGSTPARMSTRATSSTATARYGGGAAGGWSQRRSGRGDRYGRLGVCRS